MTTKRIIYTNPAGALCVVIPAPAGRRDGELESDWLARIALRSVPAGVSSRIVERVELPASREYRDAWEDSGSQVRVNMPKARLIRLTRLLARRGDVLDRVRELIDRADDDNDAPKANQLRAQAKRLRNLEEKIRIDIALLDTPAALSAYDPGDLGD